MTNPQQPVSPEQLAANRANAAKSTGPRTPQGKTRSAQNARKHGFTASTFAVVRLEELDEVAHLKDDLLMGGRDRWAAGGRPGQTWAAGRAPGTFTLPTPGRVERPVCPRRAPR